MNVMPENWILTSLQEITKYIQRGISPKYVDSDGVPVVNQKAIRWDGIKEEFLKYLDREQFSKISEERHLQLGDVLINSTGTGTVGRACILDSKELSKARVVDSHVTIIRGDANAVIPKYIYYWMRSRQVQERLDGLYTGTTNQIELTRNVLLNLEIPLPPLPEQKRIVAKLDNLFTHLDQLKAHLQNIPTLLKQFRQAVLTQAVTGKLTEEWRSENSVKVFDNFLESNVEPNPFQGQFVVDGWVWSTISSVTNLISGYAFKSTEFVTEGYQLIRMGNLYGDKLDLSRNPVYLPITIDDSLIQKYSIKERDILLTLTGTKYKRDYGYAVEVKRVNEVLLLNQRILALRPIINHQYFLLVLQSEIFREQFFSFETGGNNQGNVGTRSVSSIIIPLPSLEEQKEIVHRVESLFAVADRIEASYTTLQEKIDHLPQAILSKAFRGELLKSNVDSKMKYYAAKTDEFIEELDLN